MSLSWVFLWVTLLVMSQTLGSSEDTPPGAGPQLPMLGGSKALAGDLAVPGAPLASPEQ